MTTKSLYTLDRTSTNGNQIVRGHCGVEDWPHWVRDTRFNEDHTAVRTGHTASLMATLRNAEIGLLRATGHPNIAAAAMARRPERVLNLIDRPHPRQHHETVHFE